VFSFSVELRSVAVERETQGLDPRVCDLSSGDVNSVQQPVIAVAVQARGRDQRGQTLDQLQRCQPQLGTPIGLRLVEAIDERILAELLEALQRNGRPRAIAQQPFQAGAVGAFDADRSIQRKRSDSEVSVQANAGFAGVKRSGRSQKPPP